MAKLRPTLSSAGKDTPIMRDGTAYLLIYNAVQDAPGLIHGKLRNGEGEYCAIGNYFERHARTGLPSELIDEVAAVNDSVPHKSMRQRKLLMLRWLRWRLNQLGVPGFEKAKP
jgi:hypothetical protein